MRRDKYFFSFFVMTTLCLLTACSSRYNRLLPGTWYYEMEDTPSFILYDDGTCEIDGEYGSGSWSVVNKNVFKMTNLYGDVETGTIKSISKYWLLLTNGDEDATFYKTTEAAE